MESLVQFKANFVHDSCTQWNLANDIELLKHLERFSEVIIKNATIAGKCMDSLEESLTFTYLKVKGVSNEFHSVGNNQFVENRAHDEDETVEGMIPEKKDFSGYSENPPLIGAKLDESISTCIRLLEDKFESIQLSESDSDEEGLEHSQVVLKPRKCYVERPLPHIIGSYKFLNDSSLGLSVILQEREDSAEIEDESCNFLTRNNEEGENHQPQVEQLSESISLSRKSQEDSFSSYEVISGNDLHQGKHSTFRIMARHNDNNYDDIESSNSENNVPSLPKPAALNTELLVPSTDTGVTKQSTVINDPHNDEDKTLSKETMKSVLEHLFSSPPQDNFFSKSSIYNNDKVDHKDEIDDCKTERKSKVNNTKILPEIFDGKSSEDVLFNKFVQTSSLNLFPPRSPIDSSVEDDILPNIRTKTLQSLAKNRAKNVKKRPPSRKKRDEVANSNLVTVPTSPDLPTPDFNVEPLKSIAEDERPNETPKNNMLSPSTDEEDLFTVCNSLIPSDLSSDRLFQPFTHTESFSVSKKKSLKSDLPDQPPKQKTPFWDPFADVGDDDDDTSFFKQNTSWNSQKSSKRSEKLICDLGDDSGDENLFAQSQDQPKASFDKTLAKNVNSTVISLFDDTDDDSLFCTGSYKSLSLTSKENSTGLEDVPSSSSKTSLFKSDSDFLSDPLGFNNQDCDNE